MAFIDSFHLTTDTVGGRLIHHSLAGFVDFFTFDIVRNLSSIDRKPFFDCL